MAVSKKIGGVASGKSRRENRNQMMKNHQILENNSLVASMGSMGSLGLVVDGASAELPDGYSTMKSPGQSRTNDQKLQDSHFSQLQHIHLNNVNPMLFATGEVDNKG